MNAEIKRLLKGPKKGSFFLFGPRGTGKSSWVRTTYPDADFLDFLDADVFTELTASPKRLQRYLSPVSAGKKIVLDEVQKIPEVLDEVHRLIESERREFILTGSSARKLKSRGVNLLAGRALSLSMFPMTAHELGKKFNLNTALTTGMLPAVRNHTDPKKFLKTYVQTYLREEIFQEGLTRSLPAFVRFLEAASFSQGSVLNITSVAEECHVPRKSVENYFEILEDLLIGVRLPVFTRRAKRKTVAHPKFYFFDVGVYRTLRPKGPLDTSDELNGASLETLVFQELRALNSYFDLDYSFYYWRTENQEEVDFILYGEQGLLAFEVKSSDRIRGSDLKGLNSFLSDYPMAKAYLIYGGSKVMREGKIQIIPANHFFGTALQFLQSG